MKISRHFEWTEGHTAIFASDVARFNMFLEGARKRSNNLYLFFTVAETVYLAGSVVAADTSEVGRALRSAAQALTGIFAFARIEHPPRYFSLGEGAPVTYLEPSNESHINIINWQKAFYLAVITRQSDLVTILHQVSYKLLMKSSTGVVDEINYRFIDLLKAVLSDSHITRHPVFSELEAFSSSGPGGKAPNAYVRDVTLPLLKVLKELETLDEVQVNKRLEEALQGHKKYWSSSKKLREMFDGLIALPLIAVAALAHDRGIKVQVESDYLPMSWVTGALFEHTANKKAEKST